MRAGKAIIIRNRQKTLQPWNRAVFVADYNLDGRQILLGLGTDHCILPAWQQRDCTLSFLYRCILPARTKAAAEYNAICAVRRIASLAQNRPSNDEEAWRIGGSKGVQR
jgi:hypothetical protein